MTWKWHRLTVAIDAFLKTTLHWGWCVKSSECMKKMHFPILCASTLPVCKQFSTSSCFLSYSVKIVNPFHRLWSVQNPLRNFSLLILGDWSCQILQQERHFIGSSYIILCKVFCFIYVNMSESLLSYSDIIAFFSFISKLK